MKSKLSYKIGTVLGKGLVLTYLLTALLLLAANMGGVHHLTGLSGPLLWGSVVIVGGLILWRVPMGFDLILLAPLAVLGAMKGWALDQTTALLAIGVPTLVVILLSLFLRKR